MSQALSIVPAPEYKRVRYPVRRYKATSTFRRATPAERVRGLLRCQFSPAVREMTIQSLLDDPETRDLTLAALAR